MFSKKLLSLLAVLLIFTTAFSGLAGTVAASPADVQYQQETPNATPTATPTPTPTPNNTSTPTSNIANDSDSGDSDVSVEVQVGGDSDSSSENESNSTATGEDEPPFEPSQADYEFSNGVLLQQDSHNTTHATFTVWNPTNETHGIIWFNGESDGDGFNLESNESRTLTVPTSGTILSKSVVISSSVSDVEEFEGNIQYTISYSPLVINWNPAGDMGPLLTIIDGIAIILLFVAVMKLNLRVGKIAIPQTGQPRFYGLYSDDDLPDRDDPYSKQAKDYLHGYGLLGIVGFGWFIGVCAFWDVYPIVGFWEFLANPPLLGQIYDPSTLVLLSEIFSNLMVYWAYAIFFFIVPVWQIGKWYLRRNGTYLHDVDPAIGDLDYAAWLLSPSRFADLQVYKRLSESESAPTQDVKISKKRLLEVNLNIDRKAYAISEYDPKENIAYVVMEDVDPSKLARAGKQAEVAEYFRSMYTVLSDEVFHWAKKWGRQLKAIDSARIEGELMEGAHQKDEWMREDLSETNHEEIVTKEKTVEQDLKEQIGEVDGLTDSPGDDSQDSQQAGGSA